ncbi:hypothetical protein [Actinoallomurus sp. NPDC052274]|uniref:hypothetical protein n=1 Tax=Actinoallomurus sp. NPDC052274 TaxID=3155420 RepID=UPI0034211451
MAKPETNDDRIAFRAHAIAFWAESRSGTAEGANAHTDAADVIVERWAESGNAHEILASMLDYKLIEVRYAAAAYLLSLGDADAAVPVLEEIAQTKTSVGLIASGADLLLMNYRSEHPPQ